MVSTGFANAGTVVMVGTAVNDGQWCLFVVDVDETSLRHESHDVRSHLSFGEYYADKFWTLIRQTGSKQLPDHERFISGFGAWILLIRNGLIQVLWSVRR